MTSLKNKLAELIKNLKSDAVPRPPRPADYPSSTASENDESQNHNSANGHEETNDENQNDESASEYEEIIIEEVDDIKNSKKKSKSKSKFKPFYKSNKDDNLPKKEKSKTKTENGSVNTQATGNVINVVGCTNVRWGNDYYMGPTHRNRKNETQPPEDDSEPEEPIQKCNLITLVMEATIKPEHEYLNHVSQNLGKNWRRFFKKLGFSEGRIDTYELDNATYGVSEARYKLLLHWINNKDGTLGNLATLLWKQGERQIVKELAILYSKSDK